MNKMENNNFDTLDETFAKYGPDWKCEHGKSSVWQCKECLDRQEAEAEARRTELQGWLAWGEFHDLVLNG